MKLLNETRPILCIDTFKREQPWAKFLKCSEYRPTRIFFLYELESKHEKDAFLETFHFNYTQMVLTCLFSEFFFIMVFHKIKFMI